MDPFHEDPAAHGLEPALSLVSYVAEAKTAAPGQSAGSGRRFVGEQTDAILARGPSATATAYAVGAEEPRAGPGPRPPACSAWQCLHGRRHNQ